MRWNLDTVFEIARDFERVASENGCHIGLTGGMLYKTGPRKDCDFVVYKHNDQETVGDPIRRADFETGLLSLGVAIKHRYTRVTKLEYCGVPIDLIYAEQFGVYPGSPKEVEHFDPLAEPAF